MKRIRPTLVMVHRWFGIIAALWLFVAGLTGAIMVFDDEIDQALNADLFRAPAGPARPVSELIAAIVAAFPGVYVSSIDLPDAPGMTAIAYFKHAGTETGGHNHGASMQVFVDPATATVTGVRERGGIDLSRRGIVDFVVKLHYKLQLGGVGKWLFGLIALAWALDHAVAVALSFPVARKWRESFQIRKGAAGHKLTFDLHRAVGLWLFPVTLVLAVSSVYLNWGKEFRSVVGAVSPISKRFDEVQPSLAAPDYTPPVTYQRALELASATAPAAIVDGMSFIPAKGLYRVRFFDQRDVDPTVGRRYMYLDAVSGAIRADEHQVSGSAADVFLAWQYPLHSGKAFGWLGRILVMIVGLAVCMFAVTGVLLWAKKAGARRHKSARSTPPGAVATPAE